MDEEDQLPRFRGMHSGRGRAPSVNSYSISTAQLPTSPQVPPAPPVSVMRHPVVQQLPMQVNSALNAAYSSPTRSPSPPSPISSPIASRAETTFSGFQPLSVISNLNMIATPNTPVSPVRSAPSNSPEIASNSAPLQHSVAVSAQAHVSIESTVESDSECTEYGSDSELDEDRDDNVEVTNLSEDDEEQSGDDHGGVGGGGGGGGGGDDSDDDDEDDDDEDDEEDDDDDDQDNIDADNVEPPRVNNDNPVEVSAPKVPKHFPTSYSGEIFQHEGDFYKMNSKSFPFDGPCRPFPNWTFMMWFCAASKFMWSRDVCNFWHKCITDERFVQAHVPKETELTAFENLLPLLEVQSSPVFNQRTQAMENVNHFDLIEILQRDMANPATTDMMDLKYDKLLLKSEVYHGELFFNHPLFRKEMVPQVTEDNRTEYWVGDVVELDAQPDYQQPQIARIHSLYRHAGEWWFHGHWFWRKESQTLEQLRLNRMDDLELIEDFFNEMDWPLLKVIRKVPFAYGRKTQVPPNTFFCFRKAAHRRTPTAAVNNVNNNNNSRRNQEPRNRRRTQDPISPEAQRANRLNAPTVAEVTTAPSGVQDLEELDKYKLERHPGKDTPAVTDEYPVLLSLYTDGANMCKTVMRGLRCIYTCSANLPFSLVNEGKALRTALLGPPGVDLQELIRLMILYYLKLQGGINLWSYKHKKEVRARGGLYLNVLDSHERYESLCCMSHNATHGCCLCKILSNDYHTDEMNSAELRTAEIHKADYQKLKDIADRDHTLHEMTEKEKELGVKFKECQLLQLAVDPFLITVAEMLHLELLGNIKRRWNVMLSMLSSRGLNELEVAMRDFEYQRGHKKLPPLKAHDSSMHAVDWVTIVRVGIFLLAIVFSNPQNLNVATRRIMDTNPRWRVELFTTFSNECKRISMMRMRAKSKADIDEQEELLSKVKKSDSKKFPDEVSNTPNYHSSDHVKRSELLVGPSYVTSAAPAEKHHKKHKKAMAATNQLNVAPQLLHTDNLLGTLNYVVDGGHWRIPDGRAVVAGPEVLAMQKWPIFDKFRNTEDKFGAGQWCMNQVHLSFAHTDKHNNKASFPVDAIEDSLKQVYAREGIAYNSNYPTYHKYTRLQFANKSFNVQGAGTIRGKKYDGDSVYLERYGRDLYVQVSHFIAHRNGGYHAFMVCRKWKVAKYRGDQPVTSILERCPIYTLSPDLILIPASAITSRVHFVHLCRPKLTRNLHSGSRSPHPEPEREERRNPLTTVAFPREDAIPFEHADVQQDQSDEEDETTREYSANFATIPTRRQNRDTEPWIDNQNTDECCFEGLYREPRRRLPNYKKSKYQHKTDHNPWYMLNIYDLYKDPATDPQG